MEYAIIGLTTFIMGVALGLGLKLRFDNNKEYCKGYDHGYWEAYIENLEKRAEGKS